MNITFEGSWSNLANAEKGVFDICDNPVKRIVEITHVDGSVKVFANPYFNQKPFPTLWVLENPKDPLSSFSYVNGYSKKSLGTLKTVRVYPKETQINAVLESTKSSLHEDLQKIIISYLG